MGVLPLYWPTAQAPLPCFNCDSMTTQQRPTTRVHQKDDTASKHLQPAFLINFKLVHICEITWSIVDRAFIFKVYKLRRITKAFKLLNFPFFFLEITQTILWFIFVINSIIQEQLQLREVTQNYAIPGQLDTGVPMLMRQSAQRGRGLRQPGQLVTLDFVGEPLTPYWLKPLPWCGTVEQL